MKPLCVISCPIDTASGYGARARDFVKSLYEARKDQWEIQILSQRWGATPWGYIKNHEQEWGWLNPLINRTGQLTKQPEYWFQITVPNEFQPIGKLMSVGVTAGIETTVSHASWIDGINRMNLTLVSSEHAKNVFKNSQFEERDQQGNVRRQIKLEKPVEVLFEGVDLNRYFHIEEAKLPKLEIVESLSQIKEEFNYLFVGHWLQGDFGEDRKNVSGTIKLFLETFKNKKKKPGLILKTTKVANSIIDREEIREKIDQIRNTVNSKDLPNIYLLHGDLSEEEMNLAYNHPKVKAMVYLGHGEGFGRPLLEFSACKKPIIASGWSGHLDFLNPEFTVLLPGTLQNLHRSAVVENMLLAESQWFKVDQAAAKKALEDVYENYSKFVDNAKRQSHYVRTNFSMEKMTELLNNAYLETFPKPVELKLPQLKKIELPTLNKVQ
jgi:glycosyltransferase involved in cell wall biosynthesis